MLTGDELTYNLNPHLLINYIREKTFLKIYLEQRGRHL